MIQQRRRGFLKSLAVLAGAVAVNPFDLAEVAASEHALDRFGTLSSFDEVLKEWYAPMIEKRIEHERVLLRAVKKLETAKATPEGKRLYAEISY